MSGPETIDGNVPAPAHPPTVSRTQASKIEITHLDRLAIVYLRQSTSQQVTDHPESTARQYALAGRAEQLGWRKKQILVIDDDLGCSGRSLAGRAGFQRLLDELAGDHVGLVLGLEMSRLARSGRDWHHLFELCALHRSLLADEDGVYDPLDANDRMLLGLKGIMSEVELHVMRSRLERGRLNKAERGELFHHVPRGYVRLPGGGVDKDPDEQVRSIVQLVFEKFDELSTATAVMKYLMREGIRLPTRQFKSGALTWQRPGWDGVYGMLRHPIYAGAYAYGLRTRQERRKNTGQRRSEDEEGPWRPEDEWQVLIRDRVPAYIDWSQYLVNRERLRQNRTTQHTHGACREGPTLLSGLLFCGRCGRRMQVQYQASGRVTYCCYRPTWDQDWSRCGGLGANVIDELVARQLLVAMEPASLELSMQVIEDREREHQRLRRQFAQEVERAEQEARTMERNCLAVDPENRLVRRTLEQRWEEALCRQREAREAYERFLEQGPATPTEAQRQQIASLSSDLPALWHSTQTRASERQEIVRCLVERVTATLDRHTQHVPVEIRWAGGFVSRHSVIRTVQTYEHLEEFPQLRTRLIELRRAGYRSPQIARMLTEEGFRTPRRRAPLTTDMVCCLMCRPDVRQPLEPRELPPDCWRVQDLAKELGIAKKAIKAWALHHGADIVQRPFGGTWVLRLDAEQLNRLRDYAKRRRRNVQKTPASQTSPQPKRS